MLSLLVFSVDAVCSPYFLLLCVVQALAVVINVKSAALPVVTMTFVKIIVDAYFVNHVLMMMTDRNPLNALDVIFIFKYLVSYQNLTIFNFFKIVYF